MLDDFEASIRSQLQPETGFERLAAVTQFGAIVSSICPNASEAIGSIAETGMSNASTTWPIAATIRLIQRNKRPKLRKIPASICASIQRALRRGLICSAWPSELRIYKLKLF